MLELVIMAKTKQDLKYEWERDHVQRVLDFKNSCCGSQIKIKGKAVDVYPQLKGQSNWDWVCYDEKTGEEIAVEVKRITDTKIEEKSSIMWQLLREIQHILNESKILPGIFSLSLDIPQDYSLPFRISNNRQVLRDTIIKVVQKAAQTLELNEELDLAPQIQGQLSFKLPDFTPLTLYKLSDQGSAIYKSSGVTGGGSIEFDESELEEFELLVTHSNEQLKLAKVKETFLVIIEEGFRHKDPPEIEAAFAKIKLESHSEIRHVYFVRGKEVAEISLPSS